MPVLVDVIISFALIFLLFSILVSGMTELWQLIIRKRALFLHDAINDVFNDHLNKNYAHLIYTHPLVDQLKEKKTILQQISWMMRDELRAFLNAQSEERNLFDVVAAENPRAFLRSSFYSA